jgi:hypothetical protein
MARYSFRLSFKLPAGDHINFDGEELELLITPDGQRIRVRSGRSGAPIKASEEAAILGGDYASPEDARASGGRAREALLVWAVESRSGLDLGDGRPRGRLTDYGKVVMERQLGRPVRQGIHGLDVFETQEGLRFVSIRAEAAIGRSADFFKTQMTDRLESPLGLSEKQLLAAELYCAAYFDVSFRSRFISLITAVEALLQPARRGGEVQAFVDDCAARLDLLAVEPEIRQSLRSSMEWMRSDSVGHTGRLLSERLLPNGAYKGMTPARFFSYCYGLRSEIVHDGKPAAAAVDLVEVANTCQAFVGDLLLASFKERAR